MARVFYTTSNLISDVRGLVDESNQDVISDATDILPALNRGQVFAFDILSRRYPEPILKHAVLVMSAGVAEYAIPEDCFEDKIEKVEFTVVNAASSTQVQCRRISYRDISEYEVATTVALPTYYCVVGRSIRLVPAPTAVYNARIWYLRDPIPLVAPEGRVTSINLGSNYINVDAAGADISSDSTTEGSYVNIINGATGEIRGSLQIQSITGTQIQFRSSPVRSSIHQQTISSTIPSTTTLDDYVSLVRGTCVPFYGSTVSNFLVQFAVAEITRKLGGSAMTEEQILQKYEKQVETSWSGRENQMRITKNNTIWGTSSSNRRVYPTIN